MSSDKDKTVFRNTPGAPRPTPGGDRTVIRPTPGGRGAPNQTPPQQPVADAAHQHMPTPQAPSADLRRTRAQNYAIPDAASFKSQFGLNPIVNAATVLIGVFVKTRQTVSHANVGALYQQLVNEIRTFEANMKDRQVAPENVLAARYVVCTALDEIVLSMPWGAESGWAQRTLLSTFHSETHGGEKFFLLLDKMKDRPHEHIDVLELMYVFLSLGYEGRYRLTARGREAVERIRDDLFRLIRMQRGDHERALSGHWQGLGRTKKTLAHYVPLWVVASIFAGVLALSYTGFRFFMYRSSDAVVQQLETIADGAAAENKLRR